MAVGKQLTGDLSEIVGPGRMWLDIGLIAAGYLPLRIYA